MDCLFDHIASSRQCQQSTRGHAVVSVTTALLGDHLDALKKFLGDETQFRAVLTALAGHCTAIVGTAGTGKTFTTRLVITTLMLAFGPHRVLTSCSINLAGQRLPPGCRSLHSLACMGGDDSRTAQRCIDEMQDCDRVRWCNARTLVLDESFRLSAGDPLSPLGKTDVICRALRRCDLPFGGLQVVFTGDPIQLMSGGSGETVGTHAVLSFQYRGVGFKEVALQRVWRTGGSPELAECIDGLLDACAAGDVDGKLSATRKTVQLLESRELRAGHRGESLYRMSDEAAERMLDAMRDEAAQKAKLAVLAAEASGVGRCAVSSSYAAKMVAAAQQTLAANGTGASASDAVFRHVEHSSVASVPRGSTPASNALGAADPTVSSAARSAADTAASAFSRATHLVWSNKEADKLRRVELARARGQGLTILSRVARTVGQPPRREKWVRSENLSVFVGLVVRFVTTVVAADGVRPIAVNGTRGVVTAITADSAGALWSVTVSIAHAWGAGGHEDVTLTWDMYESRCEERFDDAPGVGRYQFPFVSGFALTISSAQGMEFDELVVHFTSYIGFLQALGALYLALTRAKALERLWLRSEQPITAALLVNNTDRRMVRWVQSLREGPVAGKLLSVGDALVFRGAYARRLVRRLSAAEWQSLGQDVSNAIRAALQRSRDQAVLQDARALHAAIRSSLQLSVSEESNAANLAVSRLAAGGATAVFCHIQRLSAETAAESAASAARSAKAPVSALPAPLPAPAVSCKPHQRQPNNRKRPADETYSLKRRRPSPASGSVTEAVSESDVTDDDMK